MQIKSWGEVRIDDKEMRALMRSAGGDVKTKTARLINQSDGGGRTYGKPGGGWYDASQPYAAPVRRTGKLRGSLKNYVLTTQIGFAVRAREFYALFLEGGAKGGGNPGTNNPLYGKGKGRRGTTARAKGVYKSRVLEPRPFLDRVLAQEAPDIERRVRQAMSQALKWKATK